ncbi:asparagine synthase-related protein [Embleya sp. NPDC127516]|uniref:asparagine synthase-related protein n=1 Tax=Embleya sp. NPDC127516 TaxID=3363990 RepID=UPI003829C160
MEWITGGPGARRPVGGAHLGAGWDAWSIGARWRSVERDGVRMVVVGECTADEHELGCAARAFGREDVRASMGLSGSMWVLARRGRERWVYGDLAGVRPVYVADTPRGVVWASRMTPLAALTGAAVDWTALVAEMSVGGVDSPGRPGFAGVRQVRPGWALVLDDDGSWAERDVRGPRGDLSLAEAAALLRPALTTAVRRRVGEDAGPARRWSADVSGGLDSGTIGALAADEEHGTDVLGCLYHDAHTSVADLDGARGIAARFPSLDLRVTLGDVGTVHYTGLDGALPLPVTDRPAFSVSMRAMDRAYLAPAVEHGCTDHLIGVGGDEVLDAPTAWWADYLHTRGTRDARRHIVARARLAKTAPGPIVAAVTRLAATARDEGLRAAAHDLERGAAPVAPGLAWAWPTSAAAWLSADGRAGVAELLRAEAESGEGGSPGGCAQDVVVRSGGRSVAALGDLHGEFALRVHAPFLDNQVVDAALSAPGWLRRDPHVFKPVLGVAMRGLVPDVVLDRRSKGTFTPTMLLGIRRNLPALRALVHDGALARSGLVETRAAVAALESAGDGNGRAPLAALNQAIALEVWTTGADTDPRTWWEDPS